MSYKPLFLTTNVIFHFNVLLFILSSRHYTVTVTKKVKKQTNCAPAYLWLQYDCTWWIKLVFTFVW